MVYKIQATEEEYAVFLLLLMKSKKIIKKQKRELLGLYESVREKAMAGAKEQILEIDQQQKEFIQEMIGSFLSQTVQYRNNENYRNLALFRDRVREAV
jgi:hypothetical protein